MVLEHQNARVPGPCKQNSDTIKSPHQRTCKWKRNLDANTISYPIECPCGEEIFPLHSNRTLGTDRTHQVSWFPKSHFLRFIGVQHSIKMPHIRWVFETNPPPGCVQYLAGISFYWCIDSDELTRNTKVMYCLPRGSVLGKYRLSRKQTILPWTLQSFGCIWELSNRNNHSS